MARVALEDWQEQIRDPKIECMSRDEMTALQSERLVRQVKNVYENVAFYRKKMDDMEWSREISKESKISVSFHLQQKKT